MICSNFVLLSLLFVSLFSSLSLADNQTITVHGQTICHRRSVKGLHVELREHDTFDPDDSLGSTTTGLDGSFKVRGLENEIGSIRPYLRITHKCDVKDELKCRRVTEIDIPKEKVNNGVYEMHFVNLNVHGHRDTENCDE
ncbi:hypothetical protein niasHS_017489 [Heterodera schachtii]|uniref:Uncharacterized protein n=1 Tax=Heterodera schachtii TaxID=97005 RepID=A0ABD2I3S4_HETSC